MILRPSVKGHCAQYRMYGTSGPAGPSCGLANCADWLSQVKYQGPEGQLNAYVCPGIVVWILISLSGRRNRNARGKLPPAPWKSHFNLLKEPPTRATHDFM